MSSKDADIMTNGVHPDQTAPLAIRFIPPDLSVRNLTGHYSMILSNNCVLLLQAQLR